MSRNEFKSNNGQGDKMQKDMERTRLIGDVGVEREKGRERVKRNTEIEMDFAKKLKFFTNIYEIFLCMV